MRARILAAHTGLVLPEHYDLTIKTGEDLELNKTDFTKITSEVFVERCGTGSFLLEWAADVSGT